MYASVVMSLSYIFLADSKGLTSTTLTQLAPEATAFGKFCFQFTVHF